MNILKGLFGRLDEPRAPLCECGKSECLCHTRRTFLLGLSTLVVAGSVARIVPAAPQSVLVGEASWGTVTTTINPNFPAQLQAILQKNFLQREFQDTLNTEFNIIRTISNSKYKRAQIINVSDGTAILRPGEPYATEL